MSTRVPGHRARSRDAERTKAEILRAARDEFCEQGFNGARVDAIAARAKANKRLLYHYYGNKEALYLAVLFPLEGMLADATKRYDVMMEIAGMGVQES